MVTTRPDSVSYVRVICGLSPSVDGGGSSTRLVGGCNDLEKSLGMLDHPQNVESIRDLLREDWANVEALRQRLVRLK